MANPLLPTADQDTTDGPDLERQRKSARDEASARSAGAQRRYRLNMLGTMDARIRLRRRQNLLRSSKLRTGVGTILVLAASVWILQHKPMVLEALRDLHAHGESWVAKLRAPPPEVVHSPASPVNVRSEVATRPVRANDLLPAPQLSTTAEEPTSGPLMPSPIPGAPLESLAVAASGRQVVATLPAKSRAQSEPSKPVALQAITPSPEDVEAPPIASELQTAVAAARRKLGEETKQKQSSTHTTGVFVDLPRKPAGSMVLDGTGEGQAPPFQVQTTPAFTLVQTIEGGILVRTGRSVTPYKVGETLPDGTKLVHVDATAGTFRAVEPDPQSSTQAQHQR